MSRIAAGEVVERPTNIVKELVENSIDAGATQIFVTISDGGRDSIKIFDNGEGISSNSLSLAFELHTTSKIENEDISNIESLGFRGEALASIASVSRVEVISRKKDEDKGHKLIIEGGKIVSSDSVERSHGTSLTVSSIFFNTPARRKFLKSANTERKRISDLMTNYCLMYPDIHFKLDEENSSGKTINRLESPSRTTTAAVLFDLFGPDIVEQLFPVRSSPGIWEIEGYISSPMINRSDRSMQFININGRPVRHKRLQSTIEEAYRSQLLRNTHPIIILKITGPYDEVDFNIHPQKSEIRFKDSDTLIEDLPEIVLSALEEHTALPEIQKAKLNRIRTKSTPSSVSQQSRSKAENSVQSAPHVEADTSKPRTVQTSLFTGEIAEDTPSQIQVLGHVMNKFGIVSYNNEVWLMDVHAADERVKFEHYAESNVRDVSRQQFLTPMSVSLTGPELLQVLEYSESFGKYGFQISNGGPGKLLVHSVPVYYDQEPTPQTVSELISDFLTHLTLEDDEYGLVETPLDRLEYGIVSRLACHGSVRSGYPVSSSKIRQVAEQLLKCKFPWTCAHGRPTVLRLSKKDLESMFKR